MNESTVGNYASKWFKCVFFFHLYDRNLKSYGIAMLKYKGHAFCLARSKPETDPKRMRIPTHFMITHVRLRTIFGFLIFSFK